MNAVKIEGLGYSYPDGRRALACVTLSVVAGESVGVLGSNGAGKTTLLLHLNGILRGTGAIRILGMDVNGGNMPLIRSKVGLVFQDPESQLFCPTVFDDVAFGPLNLRLGPDEVRDRVRNALDAVGMAGFDRRSPHHLSVGEKKRASIATVLAMKPEILALDEPSANLDPRARRELVSLLDGLAMTKIIASHDLDLVGKLCRRVVLLNRGRVAADGPASVVLSDETLLRANGL